MRCASCGTENEPNSRFCGGCGARIQQSQVAPTQKISDDAPLPSYPPDANLRAVSHGHHAPRPNTAPVVAPHLSIPPAGGAPPPSIAPRPSLAPHPSVAPSAPHPSVASRPPTARPQEIATGSRPPPTSAASVSLVAPPRRWGLIIGLIVLDLGLAAAGAWMLHEGLSAPGPAPSTATDPGSSAASATREPPSAQPVPPPRQLTATGSVESPPPAAADVGSAAADPAPAADPTPAAEAAIEADTVKPGGDAPDVSSTVQPPPAPAAKPSVKPAPKKSRRASPPRRRAPVDPYAN